MDSHHSEQVEYIHTLSQRILSFLPNRTGHSMAEIELNPQFITTKRILVDTQARHPQAISYIIYCCSTQLASMNDSQVKLRHRDERSVTTALMLCKLLAEILQENWHRQKTVFTSTVDYEIVRNYMRFSHYQPPAPIEPSTAVPVIIDTFTNLLSSRIVKSVLELVCDRENGGAGCSDPNHRRTPSRNPIKPEEPSRIDSYIMEIDNCLEVILRYIAAANPDEYYSYVHRNLFGNNGEFTDETLKRYTPLLKYMFFSEGNATRAARDNSAAVARVRSAVWKVAFLSFVTINIRNQVFCRPEDYARICNPENRELEKWSLALFDSARSLLASASDRSVSKRSAIFVQTWLLLVVPGVFEGEVAGSRRSDPRRHFIGELLDPKPRDIEGWGGLINIFHVGARVPHDHPVAKFTLKHIDATYERLRAFPRHLGDECRYENCIVSIFIAALMIKPQEYIQLLIRDFIDKKDSIRDVKVLVKIIKGAVVNRPVFDQVMRTLAVPLKSMVFSTASLLSVPTKASPPQASRTVSGSVATTSNSQKSPSSAPPSQLALTSRQAYPSSDAMEFDAEAMLADLFEVFSASPSLYFNGPSSDDTDAVAAYGHEVVAPLQVAFERGTRTLFDAGCELALILDNDTAGDWCVANRVVISVCEAAARLSVTDPRFKASFVFLNKVMARRQPLVPTKPAPNAIVGGVGAALEKVLLMSLCTHDIQFYNIAKQTMQWYIGATSDETHPLRHTFERIISENTVFTGFVSLHKKFRSILREAYATESLYQVWTVLYQRWLETLEGPLEDNLVFRHFTGFLVATAGCFISEQFDARALVYISDFFDKCIGLLSSKDLVIRVVIKETLSTEAHSRCYLLIVNKLLALAHHYVDKEDYGDEARLLVEQSLVILASMIGVKNDGSFLVISLLPELLPTFNYFIDNVAEPSEQVRLKLRFCKLGCAIEMEKWRFGIMGSIRMRNQWAKKSAEWLDKALFHDSMGSEDDELVYMNVDFATQCSKVLALQLEDSVLEVPEGIKESEQRKYKDLAFGNFFSLFYKIIQKYSGDTQGKTKYKVHLIADNVLKCVSTILQSDTDIGMQFVLPLGYHANPKIRALFLTVFSNMLQSRQTRMNAEEFPDDLVAQLGASTVIFGAVARVASSTEHSLLASALSGVFGWTRRLDQLFRVLLTDEIVGNCQRSVDIFRRNSTITRLLSSFAKENGLSFIQGVVPPFLHELIESGVAFEVEKSPDERDSREFMRYFNKLIDLIVTTEVPASLRFVCHEICEVVDSKFHDAALVAVGSFLFLRFLCPAIISPESYVSISVTDSKVKRSLMQLVKVLQNVANDSLSLLKWPALASHQGELAAAKDKVYAFLRENSLPVEGYPFVVPTTKPIAELRYLHKFLYTYSSSIRQKFFLGDPYQEIPNLRAKIDAWCRVDRVMYQLRLPKPNVKLQIAGSYKPVDSAAESTAFDEFMSQMSVRYLDRALDSVIIRNSIFGDGTPVVVMSFRYMASIDGDIQFMLFKLFETAAQVWDNPFYMVYDFTEYEFKPSDVKLYCQIFMEYAPAQLLNNCKRVYYFNIPVSYAKETCAATLEVRKDRDVNHTRLAAYSQVDKREIVDQLCLDPQTVQVSRDVRAVFSKCWYYVKGSPVPVSVRLGREWMQLCSETPTMYRSDATPTFYPVEVYRLSSITKCEVSGVYGYDDEFTVWLEGTQLVLRSPERSEILRFLYFSTSRLAKNSDYLMKDHDLGEHLMPWFGRLYNIVFQGLLTADDDVRGAASQLFASLSSYFSVDFGVKTAHAPCIDLPTDIVSFVVTISEHLAQARPRLTFRFFKAFFDNYDKIPISNRLVSIQFLSPWVHNVYQHVYIGYTDNGHERVEDMVRQFCRLTLAHRENAAFVNDYIWKPLFASEQLLPVLIDEVVSFAIDNTSYGHWDFITAVIAPSVEVCSQVVSKLMACVSDAHQTDSLIASRSKLFEIRVLVKICASLFFNNYMMTRLFLADIFFLVTLFIDNVYLDFGADLQKLVINMIQSFFHKPGITEEEAALVDESIAYFSDARARMLFGVSRDIASTGAVDVSQMYNRAVNFEVLCDYLDNFLRRLGSSEDKLMWRSRWVTNATEVAMQQDSIFQNRATIVVGILSKQGITDSIASKFLKVIATDDIGGLDLTTNASIASSRMVRGLPVSSALPPMLVWPQLCFGLLGYSALYQASTNVLVESLVQVVRSDSRYIDRVFAHRQYLEPHISSFERDRGLVITKGNFHYHVLVVLTQGMRNAQFKTTSLQSLKLYFGEAYTQHPSLKPGLAHDNDIDYLAFIWLSTTDVDWAAYTADIGFETPDVDGIPQLVRDFFLASHDPAKFALYNAATLYCSDTIDPLYKQKFLLLYCSLLSASPKFALSVYPVLRSSLDKQFIATTSNEVVEQIAFIKNTVLDSDYSPETANASIEDMMARNKMAGSPLNDSVDISQVQQFQASVGPDIKRLQTMAYRASCMVVEGQTFED
ncbi:hypothetical protein DICA3_D03004 [Diutina catenulata]